MAAPLPVDQRIRHVACNKRPCGAAARRGSEKKVERADFRVVFSTALAIEGPQLRAEPHFADDALQSVDRLPGVAQNGFAGLMHIRGGESGETRVLLDGFPIREVFHLPDFHGPFSALHASTIRRIDVYTGGFPARYKDWLSGVLDIATRDVTESPQNAVSISAVNTTARVSASTRTILSSQTYWRNYVGNLRMGQGCRYRPRHWQNRSI